MHRKRKKVQIHYSVIILAVNHNEKMIKGFTSKTERQTEAFHKYTNFTQV